MADTPKKDGAGSLPDRLAPDPRNPPDLTLLQGWLGASSEERHRRLYLDPELSNSLEIPDDAIVHTQEIPRDTSPLGGEWVWIKADAAVKQGPGIERLYARFLRGQIQQDYFAGGGGAAAAGLAGAPAPGAGGVLASNAIACQPIRTLFNCPTRTLWCRPSVVTICASSPIACRPSLGIACVPSAFTACPTNGPCPSAVDGCPSAPGGCDPTTIYQTGTIVQQGGTFAQQAGGFANAAGGGLGFDPGMAAGGFAAGGLVGGPPPTSPIICHRTLINCPTRQVWCRPSVLNICASAPLGCQQTIIQTFICPSAVDGCPSAPGGCDPGTIYQTGTIVQQPGTIFQQAGGFGNVAGGGLGFDPGMAAGGFAAGGMVGAAGAGFGAAAALQPRTLMVYCHPPTIGPCPTELCPPSRLFPCHSVFPAQCNLPSVAIPCQTYPAACPSLAGCPSGPVCGDPGGLTTVINPGVQQAQGVGQMGFDPAGAMVGGPSPLAAQYITLPAVCQIVTRNVLQCRPTFTLQCQHTLTPICQVTRQPQCVSMFCPTAAGCQTQFCPTLAGCPSGPVCGGGGGYPGGGGGGF